MNREYDLSHFVPPLVVLSQLIEQFQQRGVVIGGVAASVLGKPRLTADLDAMFFISKDEIPKLIQIANDLGIIPRIEDIEEFARKNNALLLQHQESGINIDIALGLIPFEKEMIERCQEKKIGKIAIQLPTPEDLIIMKAVAHRTKDILDIEGILETNSNLDMKRIHTYIRQFADSLDMPEIWKDVEKLLIDKPE